MHAHPVSLCPAQQSALDFLLAWQKQLPLLNLGNGNGMGRTTVLRQFQRQTNAHWLDVRDFVSEVRKGHPLAMQDVMFNVHRGRYRAAFAGDR